MAGFDGTATFPDGLLWPAGRVTVVLGFLSPDVFAEGRAAGCFLSDGAADRTVREGRADVPVVERGSALRACASAPDSNATKANAVNIVAKVVLIVLIIVLFQGLIDVIPLRQCAERFFVLPPIVFDVGKLIPLLEFHPNIIRAANFIKKAVTAYDLECLLVRIKLSDCLHHIELGLGYTGIFIIGKEILKSFDKLSFLTSR